MAPPATAVLLPLLLLALHAGGAAAAQDPAAASKVAHFIPARGRQVDRQRQFVAAPPPPGPLRGVAMLLPAGAAPQQRRQLLQAAAEGGGGDPPRQLGPFGNAKTGEALPLQGKPGPGDPTGRERVEGSGIYGKQPQLLLDLINRVAASEWAAAAQCCAPLGEAGRSRNLIGCIRAACPAGSNFHCFH
jgi:hypothetical protein